MFLIAGLGNPGKQYEMTRHNIGFEAVDLLGREFDIPIKKLKFRAALGEGRIGGERVILAKPHTFMNLSGESIRDICEYYKIEPDHLIVIYDDAALPCGAIRIRGKGSDGGHNGMKSIIYQLQSDEFMRLRLGVGAPLHEGQDLADHVLGRFSSEEIAVLRESLLKVPDAVPMMMRDGAQAAAGKYNCGGKKESEE